MVLHKQANKLAALLAAQRVRIVLAESCTAGLAAASLARFPGISNWLCGSAVTYREATKQEWLDVSAEDLREYSAVSEQVARQMAVGALDHTSEAEFAGAITGHLGPDAPPDLDGVVYVAVAGRQQQHSVVLEVQRHALKKNKRQARQVEAAGFLLERIAVQIEMPQA